MVELQHSKHHLARYGEDGGRFAAAFCHGSDVCFAGALDPDRKKNRAGNHVIMKGNMSLLNRSLKEGKI